MTLSKREQTIAIGLGAAVGLWIIMSLVVSPYLDSRKYIQDAIEKAKADQQGNSDLLNLQKALDRKWVDMQKNGLKSDETGADTQLHQTLLTYTQNQSVAISSLKLMTPTQQNVFREIGYSITGEGNSRSIARLLWSLEMAPIPVRINDLHINSTREGADDLTVSMVVSTLCSPPAAPAAPNGTPPPANSNGELQ